MADDREAVMQLRVTFRWWVRPLLAVIKSAPWAFRWIGVDRLAEMIAKRGVRLSCG